ncbi:RNA polymerase sigma factor [Geothrix fermentans]|jgi:RNA polymerase sigma-70 factor (ECF subfamily)|uniref:RNA polymerase sigma factor n=1 Tax=Geothrix fermentans TaxID=44676 RepID=UPI0003F50EBC|nr:RNA polymerase sigma factor [Geothrix fermentans]
MEQSPQETPFGSEEAFHGAFAELYPRLVSYARRYGATFPEDIAQEAFVILMQRDVRVEHPTAFLYGTVRTLSLTERRPMKNQNLSLEAVSEPGLAGGADDQVLNQEVRERMRLLSPTFREALWLFVVEGLSIREIADILGIPEATVKTRIHRAKAQLKDQLNPSGGVHVLV